MNLRNPGDSKPGGKVPLSDILDELSRAERKFPRPFINPHEGFSVLSEEMDELKKEVYQQQDDYNLALMRKEAIQVAAMAMRFLKDCCSR